MKTPHDSYFQAMMEDLAVATSFFQAHLPKEFVEVIDWSRLTIYDAVRRLPGRKPLYTDITYHCLTQDTQDDIFLHAEQERSIAPTMLERILQYNLGLYAKYKKQGHKKLPIIVNLVLYNGPKENYPYSENIYDYFARPDLAKLVAGKPFILLNLNTQSDESFFGPSGMMELLLKRASSSNFLEWMRSHKQLLRDLSASHYLNINIDYICQAGEEEEITKTFVEVYPELKETIMTTIKQIEMRVRDSALQEGMQTKGMQIAKNMFSQVNLGIDVVQKVTGLTKEELEGLKEK